MRRAAVLWRVLTYRQRNNMVNRTRERIREATVRVYGIAAYPADPLIALEDIERAKCRGCRKLALPLGSASDTNTPARKHPLEAFIVSMT
jgi:hypothetical protein